uniref:Uncharacterized protein n=1 Tax=Knipowitschia caucasica TaxID=637954 RepID=A0AAV2IZH6_KNICA
MKKVKSSTRNQSAKQASDAQCLCSLGYQPSNDNVCALKVYDLCHHGKSRTQHGQCLDRHQWSVHCERQVCPSAEAFGGVDRELGLCLCKELSERASCGPLCRRRVTEELNLDCKSNGELELVWRHENQVSSISGRVLQTLFLRWDPLETLQCSRKLNISRPVYIVRTTEEGFFGLLSGLPEELNHLFPITTQQETERFLESVLWEASQTGNISHTEVSPNYYPEYDIDNLYNTNPAFDWGAFRQLKEELSLSWTPPNLFSFVFNQPGVYAFKLSSHEHRHMRMTQGAGFWWSRLTTASLPESNEPQIYRNNIAGGPTQTSQAAHRNP